MPVLVAGMVKCAGQVLTKGDKPVVAVTLMGVTNTGAVAAVEELEKMDLVRLVSTQQESVEQQMKIWQQMAW